VPVELRLAVEAQGQPERDISLEVQHTHRVSELVAAIRDHLALPAGQGTFGLYSWRTATWLEAERTLGTVDLRTGDRVLVADPTSPLPTKDRQQTQAVVDLLVVGGPDAGRCVPLPVGEHRVGSSRYSAILLEDTSLSRVHLEVTVDFKVQIRRTLLFSEADVFDAEGRLVARASSTCLAIPRPGRGV
jgi:hypothetical protein